MKTSTEAMENCQIALNIEMESAETAKYLDHAVQHLSKMVTVPGFRKGKAPKSLVEQRLSRESILQEALEHLLPEIIPEALKAESISAIAEPQIELINVEPLTLKAVVPLKPKITLGNYKEIRLEVEKKEIGEEEVDQFIERMREQFGTLVPVERSIQYADIAFIDIEGSREGKIVLDRKDAYYDVQKDAQYPVPGFAEKLIGLNKNDNGEFELAFPTDFDVTELAGKEYSFKIVIKDVKEKILPELNDEFAKNVSFETVSEMKDKTRADLQARSDANAQKEFENKLMKTLIDQSTLEFPPVLIEKETDNIIQEESQNFPDGFKGLENYLKGMNKTIDQHATDLKKVAENRVRSFLVVGEIARSENMVASDEDVNKAIDDMAKEDEKRRDELVAFFQNPQPRESLRNTLIINKTLEYVTKLASGKLPID